MKLSPSTPVHTDTLFLVPHAFNLFDTKYRSPYSTLNYMFAFQLDFKFLRAGQCPLEDQAQHMLVTSRSFLQTGDFKDLKPEFADMNP